MKAALVGVALNIVLSLALTMLPPTPFLGEFVEMAHHHKRTLVSSSIFVALAVGLSVLLARKI